jgi:DNA-directed RNA polymerase subunit N (RpoN/RPB10)
MPLVCASCGKPISSPLFEKFTVSPDRQNRQAEVTVQFAFHCITRECLCSRFETSPYVIGAFCATPLTTLQVDPTQSGFDK